MQFIWSYYYWLSPTISDQKLLTIILFIIFMNKNFKEYFSYILAIITYSSIYSVIVFIGKV